MLKLAMMALKPRPSSPIRLAAGTRTSSKYSAAVSDAHQPILASGVRVKPARPRSISSSETPAAPGPPVRTATE